MGGFTPYEKCKSLCIRLLQFHPRPDTLYRPEKSLPQKVAKDTGWSLSTDDTPALPHCRDYPPAEERDGDSGEDIRNEMLLDKERGRKALFSKRLQCPIKNRKRAYYTISLAIAACLPR